MIFGMMSPGRGTFTHLRFFLSSPRAVGEPSWLGLAPVVTVVEEDETIEDAASVHHGADARYPWQMAFRRIV
jgi:hypothetical protein